MKTYWIAGVLVLFGAVAYHDWKPASKPAPPPPVLPEPVAKITLLLFDQHG